MVVDKNQPHISFEFFPPKTPEGMQKLAAERDKLTALNPEFFSVTYVAGGSTRDYTREVVLDSQNRTSVPAAPHLSCIGDTEAALAEIILSYKAEGISRVVALRGDLPEGFEHSKSELSYAIDLVTLIRETTGDHFFTEVAAYPEVHLQAQSMVSDLEFFKAKVGAGANGAITQYFYNADAYEHFLNACEKMDIQILIVPEIMPIINYTKLARFSNVCGAEMPRWIVKQLQAHAEDKGSTLDFGEEVISCLLERLIALDAPSSHFYTLNQADPSAAICKNLNLV